MPVRSTPPAERIVPPGEDGVVYLVRVGRLEFGLAGVPCGLEGYWLRGCGGGLFLPFTDATGGSKTCSGGLYLLDTFKHADLGGDAAGLVLDFNYAYNPSCCYHARWVCPLAPPENRLPVAVRAGERDVRLAYS
jgi:uncharacterized protein (DUF1684 family)